MRIGQANKGSRVRTGEKERKEAAQGNATLVLAGGPDDDRAGGSRGSGDARVLASQNELAY